MPSSATSAEAVQQRLTRDADVVERQPSVVDTVEARLAAAVLDRHAGRGLAIASRIGTRKACTPRDSPPVTSWANTTASRPSRAALPMYSLVAPGSGRVHHELAGRRVVGGGGAQVLDVGAVAGLGHREAAEQAEVHDVGEVALVVPLGAEQLHGAPEQAPLHAGLHHQRQVAEAEHFERTSPSRRRRPHRRTPSRSRAPAGRFAPAGGGFPAPARDAPRCRGSPGH